MTSSFRVSPYRFTDRPREVRSCFEQIGLRPAITKDGFAVLRGAAGLVAVHPLESAETADDVSTSFCLEADDARAVAESLDGQGIPARWWDEAFGRRAAVTGPHGEIGVNEPMSDSYGYVAHAPEDAAGGPVVDVVAVFFTSELDVWQEFFGRLGFAPVVEVEGWRELRGGPDSGAVGLHLSDAASPAGSASISFKTSEPLGEFVDRMRALGHPVTEEPEAQAPHVTITDPDGIPIEIHQR